MQHSLVIEGIDNEYDSRGINRLVELLEVVTAGLI
jgi:hypothetical protein